MEEILGGLATLVPLSIVRHLFSPTQVFFAHFQLKSFCLGLAGVGDLRRSQSGRGLPPATHHVPGKQDGDGSGLLVKMFNKVLQAGLTEEDNHIKNFWDALHSFSQSQLASLIKFACNQANIMIISNIPSFLWSKKKTKPTLRICTKFPGSDSNV